MIFKKQAEEDFNIQAAEFPEMESLINRCANIYRGAPEWLDDKNNIKTINFAKSVCSETARLATLAIGIQIDGSARATWLQEQIDKGGLLADLPEQLSELAKAQEELSQAQ